MKEQIIQLMESTDNITVLTIIYYLLTQPYDGELFEIILKLLQKSQHFDHFS